MGFFDDFSVGLRDLGSTIAGGIKTVFESPLGQSLGQIGVDVLRQEAIKVPQAAQIIAQPAFGGFGTFTAPQPRSPIGGFLGGAFGNVSTGGQMAVLPGGAITDANFLTGPGSLGDLIGGQPGFNCPTLFRQGGVSARPVSMFMVPNPVTGAPVIYKHAGRILLTSSDITAHRRVNKLAQKAARGRRRPR